MDDDMSERKTLNIHWLALDQVLYRHSGFGIIHGLIDLINFLNLNLVVERCMSMGIRSHSFTPLRRGLLRILVYFLRYFLNFTLL